MKLVPVPCNYVADGLEGNNLLLVKSNSKHPDIHSLIPSSDLDNPDAAYPRRTEKRTRKVNLKLLSLTSSVWHRPQYAPALSTQTSTPDIFRTLWQS